MSMLASSTVLITVLDFTNPKSSIGTKPGELVGFVPIGLPGVPVVEVSALRTGFVNPRLPIRT